MTDVVVLVGAGQIGPAIDGRVTDRYDDVTARATPLVRGSAV